MFASAHKNDGQKRWRLAAGSIAFAQAKKKKKKVPVAVVQYIGYFRAGGVRRSSDASVGAQTGSLLLAPSGLETRLSLVRPILMQLNLQSVEKVPSSTFA